MTDIYTAQRNDLAHRLSRDGKPDYTRADAALALNGIRPDSRQNGQKPASSARAVQTPPTPERTGTADSVTITIPGEAMSANAIWRSRIVPRMKILLILEQIRKRQWSITNLYKIVLEFFRPDVYKTTDALAWEKTASTIAAIEGRNLSPARKYKIELEFYGRFLNLQGEPLNKDVDNSVKLTVDAVARGLGFNDSRFWKYGFEKIHDKANPRTVVTITVLEPLNQTILFGGGK